MDASMLKKMEPAIAELRNKLQESESMKKAFLSRYRPDIDAVYASTDPGVMNMRRFIFGKKVAEYVDVYKNNDTDYALVFYGKERKPAIFRSALEAEVSIMDYFVGG